MTPCCPLVPLGTGRGCGENVQAQPLLPLCPMHHPAGAPRDRWVHCTLTGDVLGFNSPFRGSLRTGTSKVKGTLLGTPFWTSHCPGPAHPWPGWAQASPLPGGLHASTPRGAEEGARTPLLRSFLPLLRTNRTLISRVFIMRAGKRQHSGPIWGTLPQLLELVEVSQWGLAPLGLSLILHQPESSPIPPASGSTLDRVGLSLCKTHPPSRKRRRCFGSAEKCLSSGRCPGARPGRSCLGHRGHSPLSGSVLGLRARSLLGMKPRRC